MERDRRGFGALAIYLALSALIFGRGLLGHFATARIGIGEDPLLMMWFLVWWPHAIANGLNPFFTHAIWAPSGFNLTWQTSIPLISLIAAPLTRYFGPVATFNLLCLVFPAVAAWCMFVLCRYLTNSYWPAFIGAYIFAFSPFMLGQMTYGHLHTISLFPLPLVVYFSLRRFNREISARSFVLVLASLLTVEFLFSLEVFATMAMCGALALLLALWLTSGEGRRRIWSLSLSVGCAVALAIVIVSPYLYYFFAFRFHPGPIWPIYFTSTDILNLVVPTPLSQIGRLPIFDTVSAYFCRGILAASTGYISWPLLLVVALYARKDWQRPRGRLLLLFGAVMLICSLGPIAMLNGRVYRVLLPWSIFYKLPLLNDILPARLSLYVYFALAIVTAYWLSTSDVRPSFRGVIAGLAILCMFPNLSSAFWVSPLHTPGFFSSGIYRRYLARDETVLILPFGYRGESMYWQAETHMYFRMAQGAGPKPGDLGLWPITDALDYKTYVPDAAEQFKAFLQNYRVKAVMIADNIYPLWKSLLSTLDITPIEVGGVRLYRLAPSPKGVKPPTLLEMRTRYDTERFNNIVLAADKYLSAGGNIHNLSAREIMRQGLIPPTEVLGPPSAPRFVHDIGQPFLHDPDVADGIFLGTTRDTRIRIGIIAWYPAIKFMIEKYRGVASRIEDPPHSGKVKGTDTPGALFMYFNRQQLSRAAAIASTSLAAEQHHTASSPAGNGAPAAD